MFKLRYPDGTIIQGLKGEYYQYTLKSPMILRPDYNLSFVSLTMQQFGYWHPLSISPPSYVRHRRGYLG